MNVCLFVVRYGGRTVRCRFSDREDLSSVCWGRDQHWTLNSAAGCCTVQTFTLNSAMQMLNWLASSTSHRHRLLQIYVPLPLQSWTKIHKTSMIKFWTKVVPNHTDHEPVLSGSFPNMCRMTSIRVVLKTNVSDGGGFQTAPLLISQLFFTWQETSLSCHFLITSHTSHSAEAPPASHLSTFSSHKNASLFF